MWGCGAVVGSSGVVRLSCFGVGGWHVNFLFTVEPLRLLPMVVAGFLEGLCCVFFWWGFGGVRVGVGWCPQYYGLHDGCLVWYYVCVGVRFSPLV